jgi:hypothetical protein
MSIRLSEDNHDSWGMCTTSAECKTIITVVLMVMSGMDPHMISGTWDSFGLVWIGLDWFGLVEPSMVSPLVKSTLRNGLCGVIEVPFWKLWSLLRCLEAFGRSVTTACCESKTCSQPALSKPSCHIYFPHLLSSHHKSTQPCLHYFRWHGGMEPAG